MGKHARRIPTFPWVKEIIRQLTSGTPDAEFEDEGETNDKEVVVMKLYDFVVSAPKTIRERRSALASSTAIESVSVLDTGYLSTRVASQMSGLSMAQIRSRCKKRHIKCRRCGSHKQHLEIEEASLLTYMQRNST